ncbi:SusD family protein, partial [Bacteroides ovatus]
SSTTTWGYRCKVLLIQTLKDIWLNTGFCKCPDKTKAIYCIKITMENGLPVYKKELLETRNWDDKMYLYPIPQTEYYKNPNLGQNTGW